MNEYVIPLSDFYKYKLRTKGQFIFLEALIPFDGISDEIEVAEIHGSSFKGIQSQIGNECQSDHLDVRIGI